MTLTEEILRTRSQALLERRLERIHRDAPNGTPLGRHVNPYTGEWRTYRKDYFSGRVRPLQAMDNLYDGMSQEKLNAIREQRERAAENNGVEEESSSGDDQDLDMHDSGIDPEESPTTPPPATPPVDGDGAERGLEKSTTDETGKAGEVKQEQDAAEAKIADMQYKAGVKRAP